MEHNVKASKIDNSKQALWAFDLYLKRRLKDKGEFKSVLKSDNMIHYVNIPAATKSPRVTSGPAVSMMKTLDIKSLDDFESKNEKILLNIASFHYGGYGNIEYEALESLKQVIKSLPFICMEEEDYIIDKTVREEFADYMGYNNCFFTSTGYGMNMTALPAMAKCWNDVVFLLDSESHNSMFMGARSTGKKCIKFEHNNISDLNEKIKIIKNENCNSTVVVCIEGIYSMSGTIASLPQIISLKKDNDFKIFIDEAHSLFALGKTGRGIIEHFTDLGYFISTNDVDVLGVTLSKSMGAIGGAVVCHDELVQSLIDRIKLMENTYGDILPTIVKVRLLQVIRKQNLMLNRMKNIKILSKYIDNHLRQAGLHVKSHEGSPVIAFFVGTYKNLITFANTAQQEGFALVGAGPPATPEGQAIVRLCVCAVYTPEHARSIVNKIIELSIRLNIRGIKPDVLTQSSSEITPSSIIYKEFNIKNSKIYKDLPLCETIQDSIDIQSESLLIDKQIEHLIYLCKHDKILNTDSIRVAHDALDRYGLGSCSARWLYGTFDIHLKVENALCNLYPNMKHVFGDLDSLLYSDSRNAFTFTLEALMEPLKKKNAKHLVFIPNIIPECLLESILIQKPDNCVLINRYQQEDQIFDLLKNFKSPKHITIYLSDTYNTTVLPLLSQLTSIKSLFNGGITLILKDDSFGQDQTKFPNSDKHILFLKNLKLTSLRVVVIGSFKNIGLQGGYSLTSKNLTEILKWRSRGYFFTTSPMPLTMSMVLNHINSLQTNKYNHSI